MGEREIRSCSDQQRYTVTGFSPRIISSALKSEPEKHLTTLSERRSSIFVVSVLQQSTRNLSLKSASANRMPRNFGAKFGYRLYCMESFCRCTATSKSPML